MDGYEIIYECLNRQYANGNLTYDDISLYNEMAYDDFMIGEEEYTEGIADAYNKVKDVKDKVTNSEKFKSAL